MITEYLINFATDLISKLGYMGIAFTTALESMLVPIPPEITIVFAGFLAWSGNLELIPIIIFAVLGSIVGSSIAYWFGYHFKKVIIKKMIEKHGHFLFFTDSELNKVQHLFRKHGFWVITIARFIPGLRSIISLPMGILHVPYRKFITYTSLGAVMSAALYAYIGYILGNNWQEIKIYLKKFDILIIVIAFVIAGVYLLKRHRHKKGDQKI